MTKKMKDILERDNITKFTGSCFLKKDRVHLLFTNLNRSIQKVKIIRASISIIIIGEVSCLEKLVIETNLKKISNDDGEHRKPLMKLSLAAGNTTKHLIATIDHHVPIILHKHDILLIQ